MSFDKFTVCILATERVRDLIDTFNFKIEDLATGKAKFDSAQEVDDFETELSKLMWKNEAIQIHCINEKDLKDEETAMLEGIYTLTAENIDKLLNDWNKIETEWE